MVTYLIINIEIASSKNVADMEPVYLMAEKVINVFGYMY